MLAVAPLVPSSEEFNRFFQSPSIEEYSLSHGLNPSMIQGTLLSLGVLEIWENHYSRRSAFMRFNKQVLDSMAPRATPTFRALDVFEAGSGASESTGGSGHRNFCIAAVQVRDVAGLCNQKGFYSSCIENVLPSFPALRVTCVPDRFCLGFRGPPSEHAHEPCKSFRAVSQTPKAKPLLRRRKPSRTLQSVIWIVEPH